MDPASRFIIYNQEIIPYCTSFIGTIGGFLKSIILEDGRMAQSAKCLSPCLSSSVQILITPIKPRVGGCILVLGPETGRSSWFYDLSVYPKGWGPAKEICLKMLSGEW